jgi:hypothetical protein
VNDHYEWLDSSVVSNSILSQRLKNRVLQFSFDTQLILIMSKFWYALLHLNYRREDVKNNVTDYLIVPMNLCVYEVGFKLIMKALPDQMSASEEYLVYKDSNYKRKYVQFERFRFDICALIARLIEQDGITVDYYEFILRQVYRAVTFSPSSQRDIVMVKNFPDVQKVEIDYYFNESTLN